MAGFPLSVTAAENRTVDVLAAASPIRDGDAVTGALVVWQAVPEQREAEAALAESEAKYRNLVELSPDAILIHQDGAIVFANAAAAALLGAGAPDELVGRGTLELVHPGSRADVEANIAADLRGEASPLTPIELVRLDGTTVPTQGRGAMIPFAGRPALQVVLRDVTAARRESEERLRDVLDLSLDAVYRRDLGTGRFDYLSPVNEKLTGFSSGEFGAFSFEEFRGRVHPDDRAKADATIAEAMRGACTRTTGTIEYRFRHRDGSYRWLSDHFTIQAGPDGRPRYRAGVVRDVTRRHEVEAALREREERLNLALDAAAIGTFDWDIATGEEAWDDRVRMQWDLPPGASVNHAVFEAGIHPDDRPAVHDAIGRALDPRGDGLYAAEYRVRGLCDGVERRIASRGRTYFDGGRPTRMIGTTADITEQRRAEEALQRYAERLAASNEELQRFAYVASHDLQEPLRSIVSFSQLLERRYTGRLDKDADDFIGFIVEGGNRMQALIRDLLTFSRVETQAGEPVPADAGRAAADALATFNDTIREIGATVTVGPLPTVRTDPRLLEQVFANLIGNAIKYRREDVPLEVRIAAERTNGMWECAVQDNGIGIEAEYYDRIFEMFRRLHTHDRYEGTGIGLAVVKRIVERYGGTVRVESVPGEGSTFVFTLPAG